MEGQTNETGTSILNKPAFRIGILLIGVVLIFLLIRQLMIPDSFGEYGRYRGDSIDEVVSRKISYAGDNVVCGECHQKQVDEVSQYEHMTLNCQTCHGPAAQHVENSSIKLAAIKGNDELCGSCHRAIVGRKDEQIAMIESYLHGGGMDCIGCHESHKPWGDLKGEVVMNER